MSKRAALESKLASNNKKAKVFSDSESDSDDDSADSSADEFMANSKKDVNEDKSIEKDEDNIEKKDGDNGEEEIEETEAQKEMRLYNESEAALQKKTAENLEKMRKRQQLNNSNNEDSEDDDSASEDSESDKSESSDDNDDDEEYDDNPKKKKKITKATSKKKKKEEKKSVNRRKAALRKTFSHDSDSSSGISDVESSDDDHDRNDTNQHGKRLNKDKNNKSKEDSKPMDYEDLLKMQITRDILVSWVDDPYFEEAIDGFVRIHIGSSKEGRAQYRVCKVEGFSESDVYEVANKTLVDQIIECRHAQHTKDWRFDRISNGLFTQKEFHIWSANMDSANLKMPTKKHVRQYVDRIRMNVHEYKRTAEDIKKKIEKCKARRAKPVNFASEISILNHDLEKAKEEGNTDLISEIELKLINIKDQQINLLQSKMETDRAAIINKRNVLENVQMASQKPKINEKTGKAAWNPFARLPTRPLNLWSTGDKPEDDNETDKEKNGKDGDENKEKDDADNKNSNGKSALGLSNSQKSKKIIELKTIHNAMGDILDDFNIDSLPDQKLLKKNSVKKKKKKSASTGKKRMSIEEYTKRMAAQQE